MAVRIAVVDFDLLAGYLLQKIVVVVLFPIHANFFDVVEDPFQFVQTNVACVVATVQLQVLLYFVVLLNSEPVLLIWPGNPSCLDVGLAVNWPQVDVVSQLYFFSLPGLIASGTVSI